LHDETTPKIFKHSPTTSIYKAVGLFETLRRFYKTAPDGFSLTGYFLLCYYKWSDIQLKEKSWAENENCHMINLLNVVCAP